jgi:hypothetical protein
MHRNPSFAVEVPYPATTDNVASANYFGTSMELNFFGCVELFRARKRLRKRTKIRRIGQLPAM